MTGARLELERSVANGPTNRLFSTQVPARTIVLVARPTSARRQDVELLGDLIEEQGRSARRKRVPSLRKRAAARA